MAKINRRTARKQYTCSRCGATISPGDEYRWAKTRYGPKIIRCMKPTCDIKRWELTSSDKLASLWQIEDALQETDPATYDGPKDIADEVRGFSEQVREVAEMYRESAQNIEDGFGHETYQSEELSSKADEVEGWADEIDSAADSIEEIVLLCAECGHERAPHAEDGGCDECEEPDKFHAFEYDAAWLDEAAGIVGELSSPL